MTTTTLEDRMLKRSVCKTSPAPWIRVCTVATPDHHERGGSRLSAWSQDAWWTKRGICGTWEKGWCAFILHSLKASLWWHWKFCFVSTNIQTHRLKEKDTRQEQQDADGWKADLAKLAAGPWCNQSIPQVRRFFFFFLRWFHG